MKDRFKHKLKNVKVDWDKESLWEEMEPNLPRRKSNGYWKGLALFMLLFISTCWYIQRQEVAVGNESNNATQQADFAGSGDQQNDTGLSDSTALISTQTKKSALGNPEALKKELSINEQAGNTIEVPSEAQNNMAASDSEEFLELQKRENDSEQTISFDKPILTDPTQVAPKNPTPKNLSTTSVIIESTIDLQSPLQFLASLGPFALNFQRPDELFDLEGNRRPKKKKDKGAFYVGLASMVGKPFRNIDASVYSGEDRTFVLNNASFEKPLINLSLQFHLAYQFKNNLRLESGFRGEQFYDLLKRDDIETDSFYLFNEKAYYQVVQEDTVFIEGEVLSVNKYGTRIVYNNKISSLSIPLNIGYVEQIGKFQFRAKAGISLYFLKKYSGKQYDRERIYVDDAIFSIRQPLGFQAQVGGGYQLGKRLHVLTSLGFRQSAKFSINEVHRTYQSFSIGVGLEARLGKI